MSEDSSRLFTVQFLRLWIFAFIAFLSVFQLFPTIPFRILDLGGSKSQAGLVLAVYTYASALAAPLTGAFADHFGRKRLLILAAAFFGFFSILYGFVPSIPLLLVIASVHGAIWSAILSSSAAMMTDFIPESRRTEGIAYWGMASTAAVAVAPTIGLAIYRFGWEILCLEMAGLSIVMVVLAARVPVAWTARETPFPSVRTLVDFRVIALALALFAISFGYGGITSYVALFASERQIPRPSLFFNVFATTILIVRLLTARLGDRFGPKALLYPSLAMVPLSLFVLAYAMTAQQIAASAFLFGLGFGGAYPAFVTYVLRHTDPARRGGTFGSILWAFDTGIGTGSLITGLLVDHFGFRAAFSAAAVLSLLSIPIFATAARLLFERDDRLHRPSGESGYDVENE
ncbi:MAG TPA: MFS transporter [Thermoanaerobaculia bacterium]|nr:MFS transporter [Thermoanaerobaculia bacterium]